jgi:DNA polymerase III delta subunit
MELKQHIEQSNQLLNIFIFTGPETVILNMYVDKLAKRVNLPKVEYESIKPVYDKLSSNSLFDKTDKLYVVRDDTSFLSSEHDWTLFTSKLIKNNVVVLIYTNINKGSKFYKHFESNIIYFDNLSVEVLSKYVKKELPELKDNFASELVSVCEKSYSRILLECDKLKHLQAVMKQNINYVYDYAMNNNFIYIPPEDAIFSFVDACLARNIDDCYFYLNECKGVNESELNILSNLYTRFRALLQVQAIGGYNKDICNITGLQMYQVKQVSSFVKRYSTDELLRALRLISYCESSIKQGTMEASETIDFMLVNLL